MSERGRQITSTVLAVGGAILIVLGAVALYAREQIFDPDTFADRAVGTLEHREVRDAIEEPIVDQAIDNGPDALINARPVLEAAVDGVVESGPFHDLFRGGAAKTHRAMFEGEGEELALSVEDANVVVAEAVTAISPELGKQVPDGVGARLVEITDSDLALTLGRVAHDVRLLGLILPLGGILLVASSIAVAPDRRRALLLCSASIAACAGLALIAFLAGRSLALSQFDDEAIKLAVAAVWEVFLGPLRSWLLGLGAAAILVTAAAWMGREVDAAAPARAIAERATAAPSTAAGRLGRAVLIGAAGLLVVLNPILALEIAAVLIGAYGLFYAACEAMAVIAPSARVRGERRRLLPSPRVFVGGAALIAAVTVAVAVIVTGGGEEGPVNRPEGPVVRCNGFAELCDRPLNQVVFAATHNSMSAVQLSGWYQPNQRYGIQRQLDDGVRAFLIDSHPGIRRKSGPILTDLEREEKGKVIEVLAEQLGADAARRFALLAERFARRGGQGEAGSYLCHVVCELGSIELTGALGTYRSFLETHPDEFLILFLEDYITPAETAEAFEDSGILRYAYEHRRGRPFPTLRELIESDERLFVLAEQDNGDGEYPWYHDGFELAQETPFDFTSAEQLTGPRGCVPNRGDVHSPLFQVNHWVEKLPRSPSTARRVNDFEFMIRRARRCRLARELLPNWIAVDFYNQGNLLEVVRVLNDLPRDAMPSYRTIG